MKDKKDKAQDERFLNTFKEEASELINKLEGLILNLELNMGNPEMITEIFRAMHTLKGISGMFGYTEVSNLTHYLENIYDDIRAEKIRISDNIVELTFRSIDILKHFIVSTEKSPIYIKKYDELIALINNLTKTSDITVETEKVKNEKEGLTTLYIYFNPKENILDDGTNPLYLIEDLNEFGECKVFVSSDRLIHQKKPDFRNCYLTWHILLTTKSSIDEIKENFMFVDENSQPVVKTLSVTKEQIENKFFLDWFEEQAKQQHLIESIESYFQKEEKIEHAGGKEEDEKEISENHKEHAKDIIQTLSSIRVPSEKIDQTMNLISELVIKQAELNLLTENSDNLRLKEVAENIDAITRRLRDNAFSISMVPLEQSLVRFKRMVRDISNKFGKKVQLLIEGGETELHKTVIENIIDPIMHMLRNSIDHGIETPDERIKKGKGEIGTILLKAFYSGALVIIQVIDDGAGINLEKVRQAAIRRKFIKESDNPTNDELIQLILHQGFTTTDSVSEVSGRGVGMDVVYQKIREVRGELSITTKKGLGTQITLELPLTISIIDTLLIRTGEYYYLIPLSSIEKCEEIAKGKLSEIVNNHLVINDMYVPVIRLADEFEITSENPDYEKIILVQYTNQIVGIIVDTIIGKHQAVIKSLGDLYRKQEIISGASVLGSGDVALVLDAAKLIKQFADNKKKEAKEKNKSMSL